MFEEESTTVCSRLLDLTFRAPFVEWNLGPRRTLLILVVARALKANFRPGDLPKYIECVRLLFGTLPEPFVSLHEVELLFGFLFRDLNAGQLVRKMIHKLRVIFPEILERPQPKSLQDLCRVAVRTQAVRCGFTVTHAVAKLKIPPSFKTFITSSTE